MRFTRGGTMRSGKSGKSGKIVNVASGSGALQGYKGAPITTALKGIGYKNLQIGGATNLKAIKGRGGKAY